MFVGAVKRELHLWSRLPAPTIFNRSLSIPCQYTLWKEMSFISFRSPHKAAARIVLVTVNALLPCRAYTWWNWRSLASLQGYQQGHDTYKIRHCFFWKQLNDHTQQLSRSGSYICVPLLSVTTYSRSGSYICAPLLSVTTWGKWSPTQQQKSRSKVHTQHNTKFLGSSGSTMVVQRSHGLPNLLSGYIEAYKLTKI